jgi:hypothetical protein
MAKVLAKASRITVMKRFTKIKVTFGQINACLQPNIETAEKKERQNFQHLCTRAHTNREEKTDTAGYYELYRDRVRDEIEVRDHRTTAIHGDAIVRIVATPTATRDEAAHARVVRGRVDARRVWRVLWKW